MATRRSFLRFAVAAGLAAPSLASARGAAKVVVVGGGDSAAEAVIGLARQRGNTVTLSYRKEKLVRIKKKNEGRIGEVMKHGRARPLFGSEVTEILDDRVRLRQGERRIELPNDYVFVFAGGEPVKRRAEQRTVREIERTPALRSGQRGESRLTLMARMPAQVDDGQLRLRLRRDHLHHTPAVDGERGPEHFVAPRHLEQAALEHRPADRRLQSHRDRDVVNRGPGPETVQEPEALLRERRRKNERLLGEGRKTRRTGPTHSENASQFGKEKATQP